MIPDISLKPHVQVSILVRVPTLTCTHTHAKKRCINTPTHHTHMHNDKNRKEKITIKIKITQQNKRWRNNKIRNGRCYQPLGLGGEGALTVLSDRSISKVFYYQSLLVVRARV